MSSSSFLVESLGFSMQSIRSSTSHDGFTSYFPISILFLSFSSLTAVPRSFKMMLNKKVRVDILVLFLILEKTFSAFQHRV